MYVLVDAGGVSVRHSADPGGVCGVCGVVVWWCGGAGEGKGVVSRDGGAFDLISDGYGN